MANMADYLPLAQLVYSLFTFLLNNPNGITESELAAQCLACFYYVYAQCSCYWKGHTNLDSNLQLDEEV